MPTIKSTDETFNSLLKDNKILIQDFWATWCNPCMAELPHLNRIDKNYEDRDVNVVAISIDAARHISKVKAYVKSRKYAFTTLIDRDTTVVSQYNPSKANLVMQYLQRNLCKAIFEMQSLHCNRCNAI